MYSNVVEFLKCFFFPAWFLPNNFFMDLAVLTSCVLLAVMHVLFYHSDFCHHLSLSLSRILITISTLRNVACLAVTVFYTNNKWVAEVYAHCGLICKKQVDLRAAHVDCTLSYGSGICWDIGVGSAQRKIVTCSAAVQALLSLSSAYST